MRALRTVLSLTAMLTVTLIAANTAGAQTSGTVELGVFGHVTKIDKDVSLGDNSIGLGGRLGLFVHRLLAIEAEYSFGTIGDNPRDVSGWVPFRGLVVVNAPVSSRIKLLLGAGYKFDTWMGDTTANEFEDAFTGLAGLRVCMSNGWSVRPEVVFDMNPSPNFQPSVTSTSKHIGFRVGVSKFLGRGSDTCQGAAGAAAPARGPVPPPPPMVAPPQQAAPPVTPPPPPPPPPSPPTVTLFASPSSITAGGSSTLNWSSTNATTCSAPWTNSGASSGSQSVSPTSTTTYTTTCTGPGGTRTASTTVDVTQPAQQTPATQTPREMFRLEGVYFDFDQATIKPEGRTKLDSAVTILNRFSDMRVEIQGHTDSVGTDEYNQGLSNRRAIAVRDYLTSRGIAAARLTTRGLGESQPATSNDTAAGRAQNRRVMLIEMR